MQTTTYPVYLNLKIPFLARIFYGLFCVCLIGVLAFWFYMLPSGHAPDEMKAAYFVLTTSEWEKGIFIIALTGTPFFLLLYRASRYKQNALLNLLPGRLEIVTNKAIASYSTGEITHIYCNDAMRRDGFPMGKLSIEIKRRSSKVIRLTLVDYSHSEEVMNALMVYENIKFNITNFSSKLEILDE